MSDYVIGLTGGVASGKSAVEACFRGLGVVVADADQAAREAVAPGSAGLADVVAIFGDDMLAADGSLDRTAMRKRVFGDSAARARLEAIIHPRVRIRLAQACRSAPGPYAIASIPLLARAGGRAAYPWIARVLVVDAPEATRLERLTQRDGISEDLAHSMIAAQAPREEMLAIADDVLVNTSTVESLVPQVAALDRLFRKLASGAGR